MKRTMFTKVSAIGVLTLVFPSVVQAFIPPIPVTDGSRQIIANQIAQQTNALETKIDIIDTNVDDIEASVGIGLSTKIDRINNNMKIPVTASSTISSPGSYILSNNITGPITITASDVSLDLNEFKITGSLTINGSVSAVTSIDIYNGAIETSSGSCIDMIGTMSVIVLDDLYIKQSTSSVAAINIPTTGSNVLITNCWIVGASNSNVNTSHYGVGCASTDGDITIERCIIRTFYNGVYQVGAGMVVRDCQIMNCGNATAGQAIELPNPDFPFSKDGKNVIRNNILKQNGIGILIAPGNIKNFIFQNVVTASSSTITPAIANLSAATDNRVYGNYAYQNTSGNYVSAGLTDTVVSATTGFYVNLDLV